MADSSPIMQGNELSAWVAISEPDVGVAPTAAWAPGERACGGAYSRPAFARLTGHWTAHWTVRSTAHCCADGGSRWPASDSPKASDFAGRFGRCSSAGVNLIRAGPDHYSHADRYLTKGVNPTHVGPDRCSGAGCDCGGAAGDHQSWVRASAGLRRAHAWAAARAWACRRPR